MAETDSGVRNSISAEPTKAFFVDMLVRDIPLEQAVLDLVDNCVDGAKRLAKQAERPYEGCSVKITLDQTQFRIVDNCGALISRQPVNTRFGLAAQLVPKPHLILSGSLGWV